MSTRQIAQGGLLTGISVIMLCGGAFMQVLSWSVCMVAGLIPAVFLLRGLPHAARVVYGATSVLGFMLAADKSIALLYTGFFGLYTLLKFSFERHRNFWVRYACKLAYFNLLLAIILLVLQWGFFPAAQELLVWGKFAFVTLGNVFFLYYDFCLTRILGGMYYIMKKRKML